MPLPRRAPAAGVTHLLPLLLPFLLFTVTVPASGRGQPETTDLDAFMARVLARRDDNWKRLQQYVLEETERFDLRGPGQALLYGRERDFTWYIRDGVFVRSPLTVDGAPLSEEERRRYENEWLARERRRDGETASGSQEAPAQEEHAAAAAGADGSGATTLASLAREPRFVSAAYFLKFRFEPGRYAFAGAEQYEGRRVFRIEYYPEQLYRDDEKKHTAEQARREAEQARQEDASADRQREERFERQMNKVALITLWVEPEAHQIVRYTFDNVGWDFLPGRSLVRIDEITATMEMGQPFAGVWLPRVIRGHGAVTLAAGTFQVRYRTSYHGYREADVKVRVR